MNYKHKRLSNLPDGQVDEDRLKEVFTTLGFTVEPHQDLNAFGITDVLQNYAAEMKNYKGRALIVIILSHGGEGDVVYGTDGGEVKMHDLQELFSAANCPSLKNAPKVFLFDACRGTENEKGHPNDLQLGKVSGIKTGYPVITNSLNFATVFASTRGNTAGMFPAHSEESGSYFTQTLVEVIKEADNKEFNEIITEVRYRILKRAREMAQAPKWEVKAKGIKQEVKPQDTEEEVMAQDPKEPEENEILTQTVQYTSTLLRLYFIKRN